MEDTLLTLKSITLLYINSEQLKVKKLSTGFVVLQNEILGFQFNKISEEFLCSKLETLIKEMKENLNK